MTRIDVRTSLVLLGLTACAGAAPRTAEPVTDEDTAPLPSAEVAAPQDRWAPSALAPGTCRVRSWHSREERQASPDTPYSQYEVEIDARGRLVSYRWQRFSPPSTSSETHRYDDASGQRVATSSDGQLEDGTAFHGEESYAYEIDRERRVIRQTVTASEEDPRVVTYGFDGEGRLLSMEEESETVRCVYDHGPWPSQVRQSYTPPTQLPELVTTYVYDHDGNLIGETERGLPPTAEADGARDFVVAREGDRVVVRALNPPPALLAVSVYEGECTAVLFQSCAPPFVPAPP